MAATKTLRVGVLTPVNTLNPREVWDFVGQTVVMQIYEPPFVQPAAGRAPEPVLFQERLRQDGPNELSAAVRTDIRFSDGTPLTARHVAESLSRVAMLREHFEAEVEARGDRVVFRLQRPSARLDVALSQSYCGVTLESRGLLAGTGPYMVAPGATPERMRLVRNPHSRRPAAIDEVVIQLYPPDPQGRPEALLAALEAGEVDFSNVLSREDIMRLKNVRRLTEPGSSTAFLYMNTERPGLDDPRVRRAIAMSIDRLEIAKLFYATAMAFAATNLLPPMLGRGNDGLPCDPAKARTLLGATDVHKPERLSILLIFGPRPYLPNPRKVGEFIAAQVDKLGIAAEVVPTATPQEYRARVQSGDYDLALAGWVADTLDPVDFLEATLSSESIPAPDRKIVVGANLSRWRSRETDELLARLRQEPRDDLRAALLKRVADEVPLFPLMYGPTIYAHSWKVKNFTPAPLGIPAFWELELG